MGYHQNCRDDHQTSPGMALFQLIFLMIILAIVLSKGCVDAKRTFFPSDSTPVRVEKD